MSQKPRANNLPNGGKGSTCQILHETKSENHPLDLTRSLIALQRAGNDGGGWQITMV